MRAMKIALRAKILVGIAIAIAGYITFTPTGSQTVESRRTDVHREKGNGTHPAQSHGQSALHALFLLAHRVSDGASKGALFAAHSWYSSRPPPPVSVVTDVPIAAPPGVPTAPPLPFVYMGSYEPAGATPVFFLTHGDRVYDVRIGDTLDNTYTVDAFDDRRLLLTYRPLNVQQQLMLGGAP
jgi:hypothetical protein